MGHGGADEEVREFGGTPRGDEGRGRHGPTGDFAVRQDGSLERGLRPVLFLMVAVWIPGPNGSAPARLVNDCGRRAQPVKAAPVSHVLPEDGWHCRKLITANHRSVPN